MRALALGLLLAGSPAALADEKPEGVLIGLRGPDDALSTALADRHGIVLLGSGVAVPRKDGWWRIDERRRTWRAGQDVASEEQALVHPAGTPVPELVPSEDDCDGTSTQSLLFASPEAFAIDSNGGGMCEGAPHPYVFSSLGTHRFGAACAPDAKNCTPYLGSWVPLPDLLGKAIGETMDASAAKLHTANPCVADAADANGWGPVRSKGRWIARARLDYVGEVCREAAGTTITVDGVLPESFTGPDKLPSTWEALVKEHPSAVDAIASPSGALLVIVDPKGLQAFAGGQLVGSLAQPHTAIVMAQWALGKSVERWRKQAAAALMTGSPPKH